MALSTRWFQRPASVDVDRNELDAGFALFLFSERRLWVGIAALLVFACLLIDAIARPPGGPDLWAMKQVQRIDLPDLGPRLEIFEELTDSSGAVKAWLVTLGVFTVLRWWLPLLATLSLPLGGLITETISRGLVERTRPHLEELRYVSDNFEDRSFPSGHVVGAVLLYGLIWCVVGRRIGFVPLRWLIRLAAVAVIGLAGFDRVWGGAHWPSDVIGGYALGLGLLIALVLTMEWAEREISALRTWSGPWRWYRPGMTDDPSRLPTGLIATARRVVARRLRPLALRLVPTEASEHTT